MKTKILAPLLFVSLAVNVLAVGLVALAATGTRGTATSTVAFSGRDYGFTTAVLASVPDNATVVIGPVEITMGENETAALQFSVMRSGGQANFILAPLLHDRAIVSVREEGLGIVITALAEGETVLQTISEDGINDIAVIRVVR